MDNYITNNVSVQVLEIASLANEIENRTILNEIERKINSGFANFVLDLEDLRLINSIGINFLIAALRKTQNSGGKLALANPSPKVHQLLNVTRLSPLFMMQPSVNEAVESLKN